MNCVAITKIAAQISAASRRLGDMGLIIPKTVAEAGVLALAVNQHWRGVRSPMSALGHKRTLQQVHAATAFTSESGR